MELGHDNIVCFFKNDDGQGSRRMKGYLKAHRKNGITLNPNNIITYQTEDKHHKPKEELAKLLDLPEKERPTAIVCYNDELALTLLDVIREKNFQVPEDISIVGFDDSFLAQISEVKLTTIKHPQSELGEAAGEMILDIIKSSNANPQKSKDTFEPIVFDTELIVRNSTTKPKNS
ncbi:substrate-binding domain-containing protein [Amphibacillus sp. Q70]|uniref:substrate-binding domain-containing protein n=1 Tax=Amphibacillus sp. Q70 TaxID=3453416 RepID=UPI003F84414B